MNARPEIGTFQTEHADMFVVRIVYTRYYTDEQSISRADCPNTKLLARTCFALKARSNGEREREKERKCLEYLILEGVWEHRQLLLANVSSTHLKFSRRRRSLRVRFVSLFIRAVDYWLQCTLSRFNVVSFLSYFVALELLLPSAHSNASRLPPCAMLLKVLFGMFDDLYCGSIMLAL